MYKLGGACKSIEMSLKRFYVACSQGKYFPANCNDSYCGGDK